MPIRLHLSDEEVARFAVRRFEFPGVDITPQEARWYPEGPLAVDAMGYVGTISEKDLAHIDRAAYAGTAVIGKTGVESAFEKRLHGTNGFQQTLVDAQGRPVPKPGVFAKDLEMKAPTPGDDVILSLDLQIQKIAEAALTGKEGAVVALDPNSGDIIALVSSPGFDPNLFARGITVKEYAGLEGDLNRPLYDRALRGEYSSGSTIKPGLALGALTDGVIDPDKPVFCPVTITCPAAGTSGTMPITSITEKWISIMPSHGPATSISTVLRTRWVSTGSPRGCRSSASAGRPA